MDKIDKRNNKLLGSPMKYIGGRFDKSRYQARPSSNIGQNEQDLYEVDTEAM